MLGKSALLLCLLAGSSSAFAVQQPKAFAPRTSVALKMSGGGDPVPALKVSFSCVYLLYGECIVYVIFARQVRV